MKTGIIALFSLAILAGCISTDYDPYVTAVENQLETRSYQTREINDAGYQQLLIAVIGTLQDYHFRILEVNAELGIVTAYQMTDYDQRTQLGGRTELTVLIKSRGESQHAVRMNMTTGLKVENEPELYQQFFTALNKKLHYQRRV
jgi:hypothetical protein